MYSEQEISCHFVQLVYMKNFLRKVWRVGRWVLLAATLLFVADYALGTWALKQQHQYALQLADKMKTDYVTLADVMGGRLPPEPDPTLNNSTLLGVDANHNGIRDDVELAIFKLHPDSARIRAAELQYAKYLQYTLDENAFTHDVETVVDDGIGDSAIGCLVNTAFDLATTTRDQIEKEDQLRGEVIASELNTAARRQANEKFNNLSFQYSPNPIYTQNTHECDLDMKSLPN